MSDYEMSDEELMIVKLEELQTENEQLRQKLEPIEPLISAIRQQENRIAELTDSVQSLSEENEKLLKFAEQEKQLHEQNKQLQSQINSLKQDLMLKQSQLQNLTNQIEDFSGSFANFPSSATIHDFTVSFDRTVSNISRLAWYHRMNWFIAAIFAAVMIFDFVGLWMLRDPIQDTLRATTATKTAVTKGLYTPEGYSVLEGSQSNIEYWQRGGQ